MELATAMANKNFSKTRSLLLSLPAELRFMIYEHIVSNSPKFRKTIARGVVASSTRINATTLSLRLVCRSIHAEATDYFFGKSQTVLATDNFFCQVDVDREPNMAFLPIVQDIQLRIGLVRGGPFEGRLSLLENALLRLRASQNLKRARVHIVLGSARGAEDENWVQRQAHAYASLTKCRMRVTKEGCCKGMSAT
jgi:hypothetical protein